MTCAVSVDHRLSLMKQSQKLLCTNTAPIQCVTKNNQQQTSTQTLMKKW